MKKFLSFFGFLKDLLTGQRGEEITKQVKAVAEKALPIVEAIAKLTPNRTDDELVALFKTYGVPGINVYLAMPLEDRGAALLKVATAEFLRSYPEASSLATSIIQTGIPGAVLAMTNGVGK